MTSVSLTWTEKTKEEQNAKEGLSFQLITESNVQCSTEIFTTLLYNHVQLFTNIITHVTEKVVLFCFVNHQLFSFQTTVKTEGHLKI